MTGFYRGGSFDGLRMSGYLTNYIRSGADMPISSRARRRMGGGVPNYKALRNRPGDYRLDHFLIGQP